MLCGVRRSSGAWKRVAALGVSIALVGNAAFVVGCGVGAKVQNRSLSLPDDAATLDKESAYLKAHMLDGRAFILANWDVDEAAGVVTGEGKLLGVNREVRDWRGYEVKLDSVAIFETNIIQDSPSVSAMSIMTGASLIMTAACIANPKACFGSCPTFYAGGADDAALLAEGFSSSVAPSLEESDVDALFRVVPTSQVFRVQMRNEALETHAVRHVTLLAARRPPGGRVLATPDGRFREASRIAPPRLCTGPEGDCLDALAALDGLERCSAADPSFLGTREEIEIEFDDVAGGQAGLVIATRQSLMTTYLFYQALSYLGGSAGEWIAELERGSEFMRTRFDGMVTALGGIDVLVDDGSGSAVVVGTVNESGPLATDLKVIPLGYLEEGEHTVRLRLTKGLWRLDYVALAALGEETQPVRLRPCAVRRDAGSSEAARTALLDDSQLAVTLPGDALTLEYELPEDLGMHELFLESRGYYLEWMRDEWMAEEDPVRALAMFSDPEGALRDIAPDFVRVEAEMESLFWSSRYAR